jgi:hypothetical protein
MELRTEIQIDAPPEAVWAALTDTRSYHEWNPLITQWSGELREGARLDLVLSLPERGDYKVRPRVLTVLRDEELRWRGSLLSPLILSGEHFFQLERLGERSTRFVHGEDFKGFLVRYLGPQLTATARGFVFMNMALKKRVESR